MGSKTSWPTTYLRQGLYAQHLARFRTYFPAEQMLVLRYDTYKQDPEGCLSEIERFLGVDQFDFDVSARHNETRITTRRSRAARRAAGIARPLLARMPADVEGGARDVFRRVEGRATRPPEPLDRDSYLCIYEYFAAEIDALEELLCWDLSTWRPGARGGTSMIADGLVVNPCRFGL